VSPDSVRVSGRSLLPAQDQRANLPQIPSRINDGPVELFVV